MKKNISKTCLLFAVLIPALTLFSCQESETPSPPQTLVPPVEEKAAVSSVEEKTTVAPVEEKAAVTPVRKVELEVLTPAQWEGRYGPAGEGMVALIDDLYVARRTDTSGTANNAVFRWEEAMEYAVDLDWLGKSAWRLPTKDELMKIYENRDLLDGFEQTNYWSSSLHHSLSDRAAAVVDFSDGRTRYWNQTGRFPIRLVAGKGK